jgi:hypothetical protein
VGRRGGADVRRDRTDSARCYRTPQELRDLLVEADLTNVGTCTLDVTTPYVDFDDFWRALDRQVGPAGAWLHGLDDHQRGFARDELRRQLGSPTGGFELHARAYAARGMRLPEGRE